MSRKILTTILLLLLTVFAVACASDNADTADTVVEEAVEVVEEVMEDMDSDGDIFARVRDRGVLVCGGRTDLAGFGTSGGGEESQVGSGHREKRAFDSLLRRQGGRAVWRSSPLDSDARG